MDDSLASRLDQLERSNRRLALFCALLLLFIFSHAACSAAPAPEKVVAAERFVLIGPDGGERGAIELDSRGFPALTLKKDRSLALLSMSGPGLLLRGPDGKTGAFLGINTQNMSRLELTSERLVDGVRLSAMPDGTSGVFVLDPTGRERASVQALSTGGASFLLQDGAGRPRAQLGIDPESLPNLLLLDQRGARRMGMIVQEDGIPVLEVEDERGRPRARLTTGFDGAAALSLLGEDGATTFQAP
jgi:hypothetical protein